MEYSPQDITTATFAIVKKGYDPSEVRSYLNGVSKALESSQQQATAMEARARAAVAKLQELTQSEAAAPAAPPTAEPVPAPAVPDESEAIGRALLLAQRTADGLIAEARIEVDTMVSAARAEASTMVADAQRQAESTIEEGRAEGRRALESERAKAESDVQALLARRDFLLADVEQLETFVESHRARLLDLSNSLRETAESNLADLRRPLLSAAADAPLAVPGGDTAPAAPPAEVAAVADAPAAAAADDDDDDERPTEAISSLAGLVDDVEAPSDPEPTPTGNPNLLDFGA